MKTFLHVGCGQKRKDRTTAGFNTPEWNEQRLDIDEQVAPDIVGTMTDMSAVVDASVDAIYSSHNIEHLYPHEVGVALAEFRRVLKPDGFVVITCPDLQSVCALVAQDKLTEAAYSSPSGPITPLEKKGSDPLKNKHIYTFLSCFPSLPIMGDYVKLVLCYENTIFML